MRGLKLVAKVLGAVVALALLAFGIAALSYRDHPVAEVEARWATPPSQFTVIDGVRMHYRDEGSGPPVVLLHANYASLFMWEPWAAALKDRYRVIRVDLPAHGLTGPDPSGDYTLQRIQHLFERFVDERGLQRLVVIGTSIGGTVAMRYAADHPERVERLGLISPGSLEKRVRGRTTPAQVPKVFDAITLVTPKAFTRFMLTNDYGDPARVGEAVVDEWWSMWMREGNRAAMLGLLRQYVSGGVEEKIRAVRAPVLLMWGERNKRVPVALAYETRDLLSNSPQVKLEVLPGIGHMLVQEAPQESARLVRAWLDAPVPPAAPPMDPPATVRTAVAASP
ncbi:MAG: alpha/beta fold hydrolase [Gammaproteobacteria bacterium]